MKAGKWKIMGGWYLQSDCNMPAGESIVRQILVGYEYFKEKFGEKCQVAVSLDCFGHSKGLVQILQKAGYTGYVFMRPGSRYRPARRSARRVSAGKGMQAAALSGIGSTRRTIP